LQSGGKNNSIKTTRKDLQKQDSITFLSLTNILHQHPMSKQNRCEKRDQNNCPRWDNSVVPHEVTLSIYREEARVTVLRRPIKDLQKLNEM